MKIGDLIRHKPSHVLGIVTYIFRGIRPDCDMVEVAWADGYRGDILIRNIEKVDKK